MPHLVDSRPGWEGQPTIKPFSSEITRAGMRVAFYALPLEQIPADFFADPDGSWTFDALVKAAGFSSGQGVAIGALRQPFNDHPDGAAVVTLNSEARPYVAIIECPIAFEVADQSELEQSSAA
jgi:hypothetical protein